jgi:hypothetical protein
MSELLAMVAGAGLGVVAGRIWPSLMGWKSAGSGAPPVALKRQGGARGLEVPAGARPAGDREAEPVPIGTVAETAESLGVTEEPGELLTV